VRRERQADDGRVVLVSLTDAGSATLEDYRSRVRAMLGTYLADISDKQVHALAAASDALVQLIAVLQQRPVRWSADRATARPARPSANLISTRLTSVDFQASVDNAARQAGNIEPMASLRRPHHCAQAPRSG